MYCNSNPVMYIDETGNFGLFPILDSIVVSAIATAIALVVGVVVEVITEINIAEKAYSANSINQGLEENDVSFDNNSKAILIKGEEVGYFGNGNYQIDNSYKYSANDMMVICKSIASHMGDTEAYKRLYQEWEAHNYGYYSFSNKGLCGYFKNYYKSKSGDDLVQMSKDVNFGIQPETGKRSVVLYCLRMIGNMKIFDRLPIHGPFIN